jgi:hypothetical protein
MTIRTESDSSSMTDFSVCVCVKHEKSSYFVQRKLTDSPLKFMYVWGFANKTGTSPIEPVHII